MQPIPDADVPRKNRCTFYCAAICLLLTAIVLAFLQKYHEGAAALLADVQRHAQDALFWGKRSYETFIVATLFWVIAERRHETSRWMLLSVIVLVVFFFCLQLIMV